MGKDLEGRKSDMVIIGGDTVFPICKSPWFIIGIWIDGNVDLFLVRPHLPPNLYTLEKLSHVGFFFNDVLAPPSVSTLSSRLLSPEEPTITLFV